MAVRGGILMMPLYDGEASARESGLPGWAQFAAGPRLAPVPVPVPVPEFICPDILLPECIEADDLIMASDNLPSRIGVVRRSAMAGDQSCGKRTFQACRGRNPREPLAGSLRFTT